LLDLDFAELVEINAEHLAVNFDAFDNANCSWAGNSSDCKELVTCRSKIAERIWAGHRHSSASPRVSPSMLPSTQQWRRRGGTTANLIEEIDYFGFVLL
jgi:hypothetical protein